MKNTMKKIISMLLVVIMLLSVMPLGFSVSAASYSGKCGAQGDNLTWYIETSTATLHIEGTGEMKDYSYSYDKKAPWNAYYEDVFVFIEIGKNVTSIGDFAFREVAVDNIVIPEKVEDIGLYSFNSKTSISVHENNPNYKTDNYGVLFTSDGKKIVYVPNNSTIDNRYIIPEGTKVFEKGSFANAIQCKEIVLPESFETFNKNAFEQPTYAYNGSCYADVPRIFVNNNNLYYSSDEYGVLFDKNKTIVYSAPCSNQSLLIKNYIIPDTVIEIASYAFAGYNRGNSVFITENVEKIDDHAFFRYELDDQSKLYIPKNVTNLGYMFLSITEEDHQDIYFEGTQEEWNKLFDESLYMFYNCCSVYFEHIHRNEMLDETCTEEIYKCLVCDVVNKISKEDGEHSWSQSPQVSDCEGEYARIYCENCNTYKEEYITPKNHNWSKDYFDIENCKDGGTIWYYCTNCEKVKSEKIEPTNHVWYEEKEYRKNPTCINPGKEFYRCEICYETKHETIPATGEHNYSWICNNDATCSKDGTKTSYCTDCDTRFETVIDMGSSLGHNYTDKWTVLTHATCSQDGLSVRSCKRCWEIEASNEKAYGHIDENADSKCDDCSCVLEQSETIAPENPDVPEEHPEENANVFSFLTNFLNNLLDFLRKLFKIA